ncbi:thiolase family protein [Desertibacillus haloalkaliphilus]|uniref:thiolase family protein n=1 Tax=Desertibacillus haloalkaliphilus TaxID=1328930 RepID=UPI001C25154E|nr:acetyl-CoA C-acetyltransferase [Desertibacillus haloalkaliphilus]MBU8908923.1 acetyl-CoA C-acetyltransferase [Desertibacillus haloalkaliphilus]
MKDVYILEGARTAFGSFGGKLKDVDATTLGVTASQEAIKRSGIESEQIDFSVVGNVIHTSKNASYISRHISLKSGLPITSPALTINRLCGSGLQAVISTAQSIMLGDGDVGLAVGTENMSQSPYALRGSRFGTGLKSPQMDDMLWATLTDEYSGIGMGVTAENLAEKFNISREEQDEYALLSQQRAAAARESGRFAEEIAPVEISTKRGTKIVDVDEHIREDTSLESLSKLAPAFAKSGSVTSGNASGINDGASSLVVASSDFVAQNNKSPLARIVSYSVAGVDPNIMGIGPVPAIQETLKKANLTVDDIDLFEVNEAFAAQYLSVEKELGLDREKTNVNGGAISLGHPVGASGGRILYSLIKELKKRNGRYGIASLCIGGGQGIALLVEV